MARPPLRLLLAPAALALAAAGAGAVAPQPGIRVGGVTAGSLLVVVGAGAAADAEEAEMPMEDENEPLCDTSLLQTRLDLRAASRVAAATRGTAAQPPAVPEALPDVPEAARAWALWQEVGTGPAAPWLLRNDTPAELPGSLYPNQSAELRARTSKFKMYMPPQDPPPDAPEWIWLCMGRFYHVNNLSGWSVLGVVAPQLVPFVVPLDHPNRTDVSVVLAPGGGGSLLAWEEEGTDVAKWFNSFGISAFVLKYRVPNGVWGNMAEVVDTQRAVSFVRHHAAAMGLNASRVGLFGASHGGRLALFSSFAARRQYPHRDAVDDWSPKPDFLLLLYPEVDSEAFEERLRDAAPVARVRGVELGDLREPPPIFVATGANDPCCPPERLYRFHAALKSRSQARVEINVYTDIGHAFAMCYRRSPGGYKAMLHEACLWMLRARHFIMWNVEGKTPPEIEETYRQTLQYDSLLMARNSSG